MVAAHSYVQTDLTGKYDLWKIERGHTRDESHWSKELEKVNDGQSNCLFDHVTVKMVKL